MPFSEDTKIKVMVACGRHCCICHKFCGNNMEIHHIKAQADGGNDTFENAIPLCFDCHAEVRQYDPRHPKGIKFSEKELILHRDSWYEKVRQGLQKNKDEDKSEQIEPIKMHHQKNYQNIMLHKVSSGKEFLLYFAGCYAMVYDEQSENINEAKLLGSFIQYIQELLDTDDLMEPCDRIMTAFNLTEEIKELDNAGFWVFVGKENRKLTGGIGLPEICPTLLIRIVRKESDEIIIAKDLDSHQ